jgi:BMFP domain-containing protein YqiC
MSVLGDMFTGIGRLTRAFHNMEQRVDRLHDDFTVTAAILDRQRDRIATLETRVAVLEEARRTTAAEVELALVKAIAAYEAQRRQEGQPARLQPPGLPSAPADPEAG